MTEHRAIHIAFLIALSLLALAFLRLEDRITRLEDTKADKVSHRNAQAYADWCGGYVQVIGADVSVEGCDR